MFNLLVYPYFTELEIMEQAIIWAIKNRKDDINIYIYSVCESHCFECYRTKMEEKIKFETKKHVCIHEGRMFVTEFEKLNGDKGILDLRRNLPEEKKVFTHKKRFDNNIPIVIIGQDCIPVILDKEIYDKYMSKFEAKKELSRQWELQRPERAKAMKKNSVPTGAFIDKYIVSRYDGKFYFNKPIDFNTFSFSGRLL